MSIGIEHIGLKAKDPERLAKWYQKVFGFEVVSRNDKIPRRYLWGGQRVLCWRLCQNR